MQIHLFKQNSISTPSPKRNISAISIFIGISVISATLIAMILIPGYSTYGAGSLLISGIIRYLVRETNRKPLLLEITDNKIIYLSEEKNELVTINSDDIVSIHNKFCKLLIFTKDENVHNINLLNSGSEQNRWEVKEHVKRLTKEIR